MDVLTPKHGMTQLHVVRRRVEPQRNAAGSRLGQETWQEARLPRRMTTRRLVSLCCH